MKAPQAYAGVETYHGYFEQRNKRRALRRGSAENKIASPSEGRRWCDATERELIGEITSSHGSRL
jgi:hypothetical protein